MHCTPCDKEISDASVSCQYCGKKLGISKVDAEIPRGWEHFIFGLYFRPGEAGSVCEHGSACIELEPHKLTEGKSLAAEALQAVAPVFWLIRISHDTGALCAKWHQRLLWAQMFMTSAQLNSAEPY